MLDDFESLKRKVAELQSRKDRAAGALAEHMKKLRKDYGVATLKEAEELLAKLKEEEQEKADKYLKAKKEFERIHADVLDPGPGPTPEQIKRNLEIVDDFYDRRGRKDRESD